MRGKTLILGLVVLSLVTSGAVAAVTGTGAVNESADAAHNPYIDADVTKSEHSMGWEATWYEDDQGEQADLPGEVNDTATNPYRFVASDVNVSAFGEFPRKSAETGDNDASALDATEWSTDASGSAGSVSVNDVTTAPGVDAVEVTTSSQTSGDTALATYSNFSITSDANKRTLQLVGDVETLDDAATVEVRATDSGGDYVAATIDSSEDASTGSTMANATGEGVVYQQQIGEMAVTNNDNGEMDDIQSIEVAVIDGNADIDLAAVNAEKTGMWSFGERRADTDGDGDNETETVTNVNETGDLTLTDLDTMGSAFDDATIHSLTIPMTFDSATQEPADDRERWNVSYDDAEEFANYDSRVTDYRRLVLPSAYDLSYSDTELRDTVEVPSSRYQNVDYATNVGSTNFTDISWTDAASSYSSLDDEITLASGFGAGDEVAVGYDYVVTADEVDAMQSGAGGGAPMQSGGGGFFSGITGAISSVIGGLLVFLGFKNRAGPRGS